MKGPLRGGAGLREPPRDVEAPREWQPWKPLLLSSHKELGGQGPGGQATWQGCPLWRGKAIAR